MFRELSVRLEVLPSTFHAVGGPPIYFSQLYMWLGDLLSTSINFPCRQETVRHLPQCSVCPEDLPSNFPAARIPFVNYR